MIKLIVTIVILSLTYWPAVNEGACAPALSTLTNDTKIKAQATKVGEELAQLVIDILEKKGAQLSTGGTKNSCIAYPKDCYDAYKQGHTLSGVYIINPDYATPFEVYCDMSTDSGGWTLFQRRGDGSVSFDKPWEDYVKGFGDMNGEFWLGLHNIRRLTRWKKFAPELRIDMRDQTNVKGFAKYSRFFIDGYDELYRLHVEGFSGTSAVGDSLSYHNGQRFSARDQDNDAYSRNCAGMYHGGWWFKNCFNSHLNGIYYNNNPVPKWQGIQWDTWQGDFKSLKRTEMKMRPNTAEYSR